MINITGTEPPTRLFALDRYQLLTRQWQGPLLFVAHVALPVSTGYASIDSLFGLKLHGFWRTTNDVPPAVQQGLCRCPTFVDGVLMEFSG